jgi:predicted restriction endonuclease
VLVRASHIVARADCETDAIRLNVHNGLLLSALWDAAFDAGLVSSSDAGEVLRSPGLSEIAASALQLTPNLRLPALTDAHRVHLQRHRTKYGY